MTNFGLHGCLKAQSGKGPALAKILLQAAELLEEAAGCKLYMVSLDHSDEDAVWVTEVWNSPEHHTQSLQDPQVRALISEAMPLLAGKPEGGMKLSVLGGLGLTKV